MWPHSLGFAPSLRIKGFYISPPLDGEQNSEKEKNGNMETLPL